jgi:serine protease Do
MKSRRISTILLVVSIAGILTIAAGALDVRVHLKHNDANAFDLFGSSDDEKKSDTFWTEGQADAPAAVPPRGAPMSFADLAEHVSPGVVNIQTSKTVRGQQVPRYFEEFFFGGPQEHFGGGQAPERKIPSLGSGFVISPDGYIVTNNHVVDDVDSISVALNDGTELEATVVGRDPKTDIALIRVQPEKELFSRPLGNSDTVRPGDWVVAIGNPFDLGHTVTAGIVSAKHRIIGQGSYDDFIQTDAAINPGNSGGPLISLQGEVIGINTAINPRANTIGFAVPINMAKVILPQLKASGHVTRGWLGVVIQPVTPDLAEHLELKDDSGALVSKVIPDGPAAEAGIEHRDVIVEFDGSPIKDWNELPRVVADTPVDKKVNVVVVRDGEKKSFKVAVGSLKENEDVELAAAVDEGSTTFGLRVQELTPDIAEQLGMDEDHGVVVTAVEPGSAADEAHLRRGDVILEVDRSEIQSVDDLRTHLDASKKSALLLIRRGDATIFVPVKRKAG